MFTVEQLQAMDYLLKRITLNDSYALFDKKLHLVVEINNKYWFGDFVKMNKSIPQENFIDDSGDIESVSFYATGSNRTVLLSNTWDAYISAAEPRYDFDSNPFKTMDDLSLLLDSLKRIMARVELPDNCSPFRKQLHNVKSLDGSMQLPFIDLSDTQLNLVSIIEVG